MVTKSIFAEILIISYESFMSGNNFITIVHITKYATISDMTQIDPFISLKPF